MLPAGGFRCLHSIEFFGRALVGGPHKTSPRLASLNVQGGYRSRSLRGAGKVPRSHHRYMFAVAGVGRCPHSAFSPMAFSNHINDVVLGRLSLFFLKRARHISLHFASCNAAWLLACCIVFDQLSLCAQQLAGWLGWLRLAACLLTQAVALALPWCPFSLACCAPTVVTRLI
jgi:hypothetical protein